MLLPYASDRPRRNPPIAVAVLVLLNFAVFGVVMLAFRLNPEPVVAWYARLGLVPADLHWYSPFTYCFLHASVFHLSTNMLFLWVFGGGVEDAVGWKRLVVLYIIAAAVSGLIQVGMAWAIPGGDRVTPIVGASGAVSALVGVFAVRFYRSRVQLAGLPFRVPALALLASVLVGEMSVVLWKLTQGARPGEAQSVAHWSHIAGFILGMVYAQVSRMMQAGRREYMAEDAIADMDRGAPLSAVRRWEEILAGQPDNYEARAELGRAWGMTGDSQQCADNYRQAILGYAKTGDRRSAAARYSEMAEACPEAELPAAELLVVAGTLEQQGQHQAALAAFEALVRDHPDAPEAEMARLRAGVLLLKRLRQPERAAGVLGEFLERYPSTEWRGYAEEMLKEARH